jgi:predicted MPP superfamily phosphohydrolase
VFGKKYVEGLFRLGPTQLYVNRGIGAVGLPFRFRCPPEITVLTLA